MAKKEKQVKAKKEVVKNKKEEVLEKVEEKKEIENVKEEKLEEAIKVVKKEIKNNKTKRKEKNSCENKGKYRKLTINFLIGISMIIILNLMNVGLYIFPKIVVVSIWSVIILLGLIIGIVLFEVAYRKDKENIWLNGLEIIAYISGILFILDLYKKDSKDIIVLAESIAVGIIVVYYLIKAVIISIKMRKNK